MDDLDNERLLRLASEGDDAAWEVLVRRFERVIWAVTHRFSFDEATRHDVFQLTWLRLLDHMDSIQQPDRLAGWLATTARNECLAVVRSAARSIPTDEFRLGDTDTPSVDESLLDDELRAAVATAFAQLDDECQQLLRLVFVDPPLAYTEVAEILQWPVGSIGPKRGRCLEKMERHAAIAGIKLADQSFGGQGRSG